MTPKVTEINGRSIRRLFIDDTSKLGIRDGMHYTTNGSLILHDLKNEYISINYKVLIIKENKMSAILLSHRGNRYEIKLTDKWSPTVARKPT
jgi:hypothetical protein